MVLRGLAWFRIVRPCPARHGNVWHGISLRGLVLHGTVLSCPARLSKASFFEVWHGMLVRSLVLLGQVLFGSVVLGKVSSWLGDVLFGLVGRIGVLYCKVRRYCGLVKSSSAAWGEVVHGFVW